MKLVAVLRDPVARAYSHYWMERETRDETRSFEDALAWEEREVVPELARWIADPAYISHLPLFGRSYVSRGLYAEQLERWLELFPREQLLVFTSDELTNEPAGDDVACRRVSRRSAGSPGRIPARERSRVRAHGRRDAESTCAASSSRTTAGSRSCSVERSLVAQEGLAKHDCAAGSR